MTRLSDSTASSSKVSGPCPFTERPDTLRLPHHLQQRIRFKKMTKGYTISDKKVQNPAKSGAGTVSFRAGGASIGRMEEQLLVVEKRNFSVNSTAGLSSGAIGVS